MSSIYGILNPLKIDHEKLKAIAQIKGIQHSQAFQLVVESYLFHDDVLCEQVNEFLAEQVAEQPEVSFD